MIIMYFYGFKIPEPATLALYIVVGIAVFVLLFFLFRLINCWYFKINHRLKEQQRTNELLEELNRKLDMICGSHVPQQDPRYSGKDMYGRAPQNPASAAPYDDPGQYGWQRPGTAASYTAPVQNFYGQAAPKQEADFSAEFARDFAAAPDIRPGASASDNPAAKDNTPAAKPPVPPSVPVPGPDAPASGQDTGDTLLMGGAGFSGSDTGIPLDEIGDCGPAFCPGCHLPLTKDTVYCPNCGRKVR